MDSYADQSGQHNDTSTTFICLNISEESQKDEPVFGCGECLNMYKEPDYAKKCFYRHAIKSFFCKVCDAKFNLKSNLKCHLLTHIGYVSHQFKLSDTLFSPSGICTGKQRSKCDVCSAAFSRTSTLTKHMRTHTGERPFKCKECSALFIISAF